MPAPNVNNGGGGSGRSGRSGRRDTAVLRSRENFETLMSAIKAGRVCLMECLDTETGKPVAVICAENWRNDDKGEPEVQFVPFALMMDENPYERLLPPDPDRKGKFLGEGGTGREGKEGGEGEGESKWSK